MEGLFKTTLVGLFFGTFGTTIGGIIGAIFKNTSNKFLSFILEFSAGLMISIVCFDLIPEALELSSLFYTIIGIVFGVISMILCDNAINKKMGINNISIKKHNEKSNHLLKTGIIVGIGLALHNFPEGLAIGAGFGASIKLGYALAVAILLHDVPEGISMSVPMRCGGMSKSKVIIYTLLSGVTTGIGTLFGAMLGIISTSMISVCLSFAAGAMLYIVSGELIPESKNLYKGRFASMGNIVGFVMGLFAMNM